VGNGEKVKIGKTFIPRKIDNPLDRITRKLGGRRSRTITERKSGRYIQARPSPGDAHDLAFDATLRAAAPFQKQRQAQRQKIAFSIHSSDYQKKIRVKKAANLVLFVVDASWSMAVAERMSATKGAILSLLTDAYQRRDRVGLVVFQKDSWHPGSSSNQLDSVGATCLSGYPGGRKNTSLSWLVACSRCHQTGALSPSRCNH